MSNESLLKVVLYFGALWVIVGAAGALFDFLAKILVAIAGMCRGEK